MHRSRVRRPRARRPSRSICHRSVKDEEKAGADAERFENPTTVRDCANLRVGQYDKLNGDFVVAPGTVVNVNDCLIAKTISTADVAEQGESRTTVKRDKSTMQRHNEEAVVDMVLHTRTREGNRAVKVRTRSIRIPQVGDKVCPLAPNRTCETCRRRVSDPPSPLCACSSRRATARRGCAASCARRSSCRTARARDSAPTSS